MKIRIIISPPTNGYLSHGLIIGKHSVRFSTNKDYFNQYFDFKSFGFSERFIQKVVLT